MLLLPPGGARTLTDVCGLSSIPGRIPPDVFLASAFSSTTGAAPAASGSFASSSSFFSSSSDGETTSSPLSWAAWAASASCVFELL